MSIYQKSPTGLSSVPAEGVFAALAINVNAPAIVTHTGAMSYRELDQRSAALAAALAAAGVGQHDVVAVCLPRCSDQIAALIAAWRLGAAYLPLDPEWPDARVAQLLGRADARALVAPATRGARIAGGLAVLDPASTQPGGQHGAAPAPVAVGPDHIAYVIYTSGSTGEPKAVEVSHANLAALVDWHIAAFDMTPGKRASHLAGLAFDAAAWEVWPVLASGGTLVLPPAETLRYDAAALADWLVDQRVEIAFAPTAIAEQLIAHEWPATTALKTLLTGADRLKTRPRPGLPFALVNNYGPTECTVVATSGVVSPDGPALPAIGAAIAGTTIHLLDADGTAAVDGEAGEIWIGGAQVSRGYRGDAALTAARFVTHPQWGRLYRTGDMARRDDAGEYHFLGRADGQLKLRGHRIEPAEIEAALLALEGVAGAAVGLFADDLAGWLVAAPGRRLVASELRTKLAAHLPAPMIPSRFALLAALPLTASGKLDHAALPDPASCALAETAEIRLASTPTEQRLAAIIAEVIGRSDFGVDDDFFLLGGHSLLGTQVIVRARDAFGVELTLLHLFEGRTVAALAVRVEALVTEHLASLSDEDIAKMIAAETGGAQH